MAPKREKLQAALESLRQKEAALEEAMQQLKNLHEELERLQQMYDAKMKEKENLIRLASIHSCFLRFGERRKWRSYSELTQPREEARSGLKEVGRVQFGRASAHPPMALT